MAMISDRLAAAGKAIADLCFNQINAKPSVQSRFPPLLVQTAIRALVILFRSGACTALELRIRTCPDSLS